MNQTNVTNKGVYAFYLFYEQKHKCLRLYYQYNSLLKILKKFEIYKILISLRMIFLSICLALMSYYNII